MAAEPQAIATWQSPMILSALSQDCPVTGSKRPRWHLSLALAFLFDRSNLRSTSRATFHPNF